MHTRFSNPQSIQEKKGPFPTAQKEREVVRALRKAFLKVLSKVVLLKNFCSHTENCKEEK